ncbi:YMGG-like glycine zipper-containing protein [Pseudaminobacter salicylatoxidans]|nr:YMGG-like glycine zipper-containing protein [Pseudaminobacter salicylatoxidans]
MKRFGVAAVVATLAASLLAGCASSEQQQRAGTGALLGAGAGALVGQAAGRNTKSTVVGAAAGALLGAAVGTATTPQRRGEEMCRYRAPDGRIYTAPCDERYYNGNY